MKMKKLFAITATALMLTACGAPSVDKLVENPELLAEVGGKCEKLMAQGKNTDTKECNNAREAAKKLAENLMKDMGL